jgi:hypothetical protein
LFFAFAQVTRVFLALRDRWPLPTEAGGLLERMAHLQDAKIIAMTAYDLNTNRKAVRRKSSGN